MGQSTAEALQDPPGDSCTEHARVGTESPVVIPTCELFLGLCPRLQSACAALVEVRGWSGLHSVCTSTLLLLALFHCEGTLPSPSLVEQQEGALERAVVLKVSQSGKHMTGNTAEIQARSAEAYPNTCHTAILSPCLCISYVQEEEAMQAQGCLPQPLALPFLH